MFEAIALPVGIEPYPSKLLKLGTSAVGLSSSARRRKIHNLRREQVPACDGYLNFLATCWDRTLDKEYAFSVVDKRSVRAGVLLTAWANIPDTEMAIVQAFAVNNTFPNQGLRRFMNCTLPQDAAPLLISGLESSVKVVNLNNSPSPVQINDYAKAISTIYI